MMPSSINIAIVDDEPLAREIMASYISRIPGLQLSASCGNALEAIQAFSQHQIAIALLDINMPEISGMQLLRSLPAPPLVIFTTAYSEYAVESYDLNAVDYLLKPISFDRFNKAIGKATTLLFKSGEQKNQDTTIYVKSDNRLIKLDVNNILWIEGLKDYVRIHTTDNNIIIHSTMKNMEEQLSSWKQFIRIHKSFIVNLSKATELQSASLKIQHQHIPVGSTYREELYKLIQHYKII